MDVTPADLRSATTFTRLNDHCRPAEHLARLVLGDSSLLDAAGTSGAAVFMVDMNQLFEQFVEARLRQYLIGSLHVHGQRRDRLDEAGSVRIKPDLIFQQDTSRIAYVADIKYKITSSGLGRESDYYQLLAYTAALDLREGLLIYCQPDGEAPPREIEVRHLGTRLLTWAVGLDHSPQGVEEGLERLADHIVSRTAEIALVGIGLT